MKKGLVLSLIFNLLFPLYGQKSFDAPSPGLYARIVTTKGNLLFSLDYENLPFATAYFISLTERNNALGSRPYYDNAPFFYVLRGHSVLFGSKNNDSINPLGYSLPKEGGGALDHSEPGRLGFLGIKNLFHDSIIYITLRDDATLDEDHLPFGKLVEGMDVLKKLSEKDSVKRVRVIHSGAEANSFVTDRKKLDYYRTEAEQSLLEEYLYNYPVVASYIAPRFPDSVKISQSGILYTVEKEGEGEGLKRGDTVRIHYKGELVQSGQVFDSSYNRGEPFSFILGNRQVIQGMEEMVWQMLPGERRIIIIPPELGYGEHSVGTIPPGSWLAFEIELLP